MAPSLESGVQRRIDEPTEGQDITLLVEVEDVSAPLIETIESTGATVEEELPLNYLAVRTTEDNLVPLSNFEFIKHIEIEGKGSVMNTGFRTRTGSVL